MRIPLSSAATATSTPISAFADVQALAAADMQAVNALIRRRLASDVVLVNQVAEHIVGGGGKRLRPLLHLVAARAAGYRGEDHVVLAAVIEFIHTATLLHDDVVDESDLRRGRQTANAVWGNAPSVLVGDFLYSRAFQMMVELDRMRVMRILADTTNRIAEGEVLQLLNIGNPDIPAALASGSVDAAIAGAPYSDQAVEKGGAKVLATDLTPGLMTVAFVGSGKFNKERPEVAERFVLALTEAARMMQGDDYLSRDNMDAYMKYTATTQEALKKATPAVYDPNMKIPVKGLADVERVHRENGRTDYDTPIDLKKVVDTEFVDKALADLGEAKN